MTTNSRIEGLLKKNDDYLELLNSDVNLQLLKYYGKELKKIQLLIQELYNKYGMPTLTEVRKFNRLVSLEAQITKEIKGLNGRAENVTADFIKEVYESSYYYTGFALETSIGANLGFSMLPKEAIKYATNADFWQDRLKNWNAGLEVGIKSDLERTLRMNSREEIISGLAQGKPYAKVAREIEKRFEITRERANTIAFDQMHKSQSKGRLEGIKKAEAAAKRLGVNIQKVWKYNHAAKEPRHWHMEADGMIADENGMFHVGGELLEAPGLGEDPKNNIRCHCSCVINVEGLGDYKKDKELQNINSVDEWKNQKFSN